MTWHKGGSTTWDFITRMTWYKASPVLNSPLRHPFSEPSFSSAPPSAASAVASAHAAFLRSDSPTSGCHSSLEANLLLAGSPETAASASQSHKASAVPALYDDTTCMTGCFLRTSPVGTGRVGGEQWITMETAQGSISVVLYKRWPYLQSPLSLFASCSLQSNG